MGNNLRIKFAANNIQMANKHNEDDPHYYVIIIMIVAMVSALCNS